MDDAEPRPRGWAYLGMFLVALVTLALELFFARIVSVMAFYHLSFFVISLALLGMTAGALWVYVFPEKFAPERALPWCSRLFAISLPLSLATVLCIPIPASDTLVGFSSLALVALAISVPFALSGILVTLTLTSCGLPYGRVYAADLFGAAVGAELVIVGLNLLKPGPFVFILAALALAAAAAYRLFLRQGGLRELGLWLALFSALAWLDQTYDLGLVLLYSKGSFVREQRLWYEGWNHHTRVAVSEPFKGPPFLWGQSPAMPAVQVEQAYLNIDGGAGTHLTRFDGEFEALDWLYYDVTTVAYQLQRPRRAAVIGVGGGRDALAALLAGADTVVAIDVNALIIDLLKGRTNADIGRFVNLAGNPRLQLVHDDARSYLATAGQSFDVIQMSLIDTWAASSAGAYTLTENGLYTREAWATFFDSLSDSGMWTCSRWYHPEGLDDTSRMMALAVALCLEKGLQPVERHLILANAGSVATLVVTRQPIDEALRARLERIGVDRQFRMLVFPGRPPEQTLFRRLVQCRTLAELDVVCADHLLDITPPTDDRPYFFNQLRLSRLPELYTAPHTLAVNRGNLHATLTLLGTLAIALAGLGAGVVWPLRRVPLPTDLESQSLRLCLVYFTGIGLGFMLIEMSFVQRFSVLLGHPAYALAVVLASMIFASGSGSLSADRLPTDRPALFFSYPLAVVLVLLAAWLSLPAVFASTIKEPLPVRVGATLAFTVPSGLVMGMCFPLGMVQASRLRSNLAPWMWGVNGAASVVGTILAVFLSMSLGISASFLAGILCYVAVLLVNLKLGGLCPPGDAVEHGGACR